MGLAAQIPPGPPSAATRSPAIPRSELVPVVELSDGEHVALAVFEPGRLTDGGPRDALHGAKARPVVLLELHAPAAQFRDLRRQVLHDPGGELVLGCTGGA